MEANEVLRFVTDTEGNRKAVIIDLEKLKRADEAEKLDELLEDLEDILVCEIRKGGETVEWETAKAEIRKKHS